MNSWTKSAIFAVAIALTMSLVSNPCAAQENPVLETIPVKHGDASQMYGVLASLFDGTNLRMEVDKERNRIIVMAEPELIVRMRNAVMELDVTKEESDASTVVKVFGLQHAQANEVAGMLSSLVAENIEMQTRLSFDARTNSVIASGTEAELQLVQDMLARLDFESVPADENGAESERLVVKVTWLADADELPEPIASDLRGPVKSLAPLVKGLTESGTLDSSAVVTDVQTAIHVSGEDRSANHFANTGTRSVGNGAITLSASGNVLRRSSEEFELKIEVQLMTGRANVNIDTSLNMPKNHPVAFSVSDVGSYKSVAVVELIDSP